MYALLFSLLVMGSDPAQPSRGELPVVEQDGVQNFGIDRAQLSQSGEHIVFDGRQITSAEARELLEAGTLTDDSAMLRLTIIGSAADCRRVLDDLNGPLADLAGNFLIQSYPPDHWAVARAGFYTAGKPTIYVQTASGKVLHRQDDYDDGADGLRRALEAIRKPNPNYNPLRDRDLRRPSTHVVTWTVVGIAVLLLWLALRSKR